LKKYIINPNRASMFYSPEYQKEHPEIYEDSIKYWFKKIFQKEYISNGLLISTIV
jgi:hypothetical protein